MDKIIENLENVLAYINSETAWNAVENSFAIGISKCDTSKSVRAQILANTPGYDKACDAHQIRISKLKYTIAKLKEMRRLQSCVVYVAPLK